MKTNMAAASYQSRILSPNMIWPNHDPKVSHYNISTS